MTRSALTLTLLAGLALWASAQSPTVRSTHQDLELLQKNRDLLNSLIDRGLEISAAGNPLERAERCRKATATLGAELRDAAERSDPDRVAELTEHLATVVEKGLAPTLAEARGQIRPGSPDYDRLKKVHADARADLEQTHKALPADGPVGRSKLVTEAKKKLDAATARIPVKEE